MIKDTFICYAKALRINHWIKNLVVYTAILFNGGNLISQRDVFLENIILSTEAFCIFCILSSVSYIINHILDCSKDRLHPIKKNRPIASGKISIQQASFVGFFLTVISIALSITISTQFFFTILIFLLIHILYSFYLKRISIVDIFIISLSFMIRTLAGEIATGYHVPIWLLFTIFFFSLFMASVKRQAELVLNGAKARASLQSYKDYLLLFLTNTFATATIITYSLFTYYSIIEKDFSQNFLSNFLPNVESKKMLMITIPFVVYGIARYAQILYEKEEGERPEKIITTDKPLLAVMFLWSLSIIIIIYLI